MCKFQRMNGVVTAVFGNRGFAFALSEADGLLYFLHFRDFKNDDDFEQLQTGDIVRFTGFRLPGQSRPRGLAAVTIQKFAEIA